MITAGNVLIVLSELENRRYLSLWIWAAAKVNRHPAYKFRFAMFSDGFFSQCPHR